ncbi:MAG: hypothetical protein AAFV95_03970 [Bacteroidota bacterium]
MRLILLFAIMWLVSSLPTNLSAVAMDATVLDSKDNQRLLKRERKKEFRQLRKQWRKQIRAERRAARKDEKKRKRNWWIILLLLLSLPIMALWVALVVIYSLYAEDSLLAEIGLIAGLIGIILGIIFLGKKMDRNIEHNKSLG